MQDVNRGNSVWGVVSGNGQGIGNSIYYEQLLCKSKNVLKKSINYFLKNSIGDQKKKWKKICNFHYLKKK